MAAGYLVAMCLIQASCVSASMGDVASRVAATCAEVTEVALSPRPIDERLVAGSFGIEVWVAGEFVQDTRIALWETDEGIEGEIATTPAEAGSVCSQLRRLYEKNPSLSPGQAAEMVHVDVRSLRSTPRLDELLEAARHLEVTTWLSDTLFAPNRRTQVTFSNGMESLIMAFNRPEPTAEGVAFAGDPAVSQPDVAEWVDELFDVLGL